MKKIKFKNTVNLAEPKFGSKIIYKTHEEIFGKAFDDPKRRTPGIEKIIKFTGIEPSKNIDFMIENIINHKKTEL